MGLVQGLGVKPGITAIIGSGGKTTLMEQLARELAGAGTGTTIALATTTRVLPPLSFPLLANLSAAQVATCLPMLGVAYVGSVRETKGVRKLGAPLWAATDKEVAAELDMHTSTCTAFPIGSHAATSTDALICTSAPIHESRKDVVASVEQLSRLATYTLVEADGSHHLPLKAHASWEPVVPTGVHTILVVGAFGFGQPVEKIVHRPVLFCKRTGCSATDQATPKLVAQEICAEVQEGLISFDAVLVNGRGSVGEAPVQEFVNALRTGGVACRILAR